MKWTRIQIKTITDAEDIIISTLYDIGLEGAQIEDKIPLTPLEKEQMFVDIMPQAESDDGIAYLSFFVEQDSDVDIDELVEQVKQELEDLKMFMDIGEGTITISETEDLDWINNWKQFFHQFYIDDIIKQAYHSVNHIIYEKSISSLEFDGMGTTLVIAIFGSKWIS